MSFIIIKLPKLNKELEVRNPLNLQSTKIIIDKMKSYSI